MLHLIHGLALECDTRLPELPESPQGPPELSAVLKTPATIGRGWTWVQEWTRSDGSAWLRFGRRAAGRGRRSDEWLLRMPHLADFLVRDGAREIRCRTAPGVPARTLRHLLIDHIVPIVLSARGHLLLHASGIRTPAGAVLFAGPSGSGKSTLAFLLGLEQSERASAARRMRGERGVPRAERRPPGAEPHSPLWRPLADDVVRVDTAEGRATATADYPGARLWPDVLTAARQDPKLPRIAHYSDKRRWRRAPLAEDRHAAIVSRVLLLRDTPRSGRIALDEVTPQAAFAALVPHVFRLDADDARTARAQFDALSRFCATVAVRSLAFPRRFDRIGTVRDAIARDLGDAPG